MKDKRNLSSKPKDKKKPSKPDLAKRKDAESFEELDNGTNPIGEPTTIRIPKDWS